VSRALTVIVVIVGVGILALVSFAGGFITGHSLPITAPNPQVQPTVILAPPTSSAEQQTATPLDYQTLFAPFWEAWNLVHENYVDQPVDDIALMRGAINGMMEALGDQHSSYMDPDTFKQASESLSGEYEGIGAYVDTTTEYLTITSPMPGSPAERAGLKPGDQIVAIDGEDMTGVDAELARRKVIGPAGTTVRLTVLREGEAELLEFEVTRETIVLKSATGRMLENDIAYVQVTTFGDKTTPELLATLNELMPQDTQGIILDLRNNGGGYLQTSIEVTSQFLGKGVVMYEQYGDGKRTIYEALPDGLATDTDIPMVVLINEGSASASEIVAGALQDHGRAKLVGVQSYGKGSVQNWIPLSDDQGAVRVTIAKWLTPNEHTIHEIGLTPDVYVGCEDCRIGVEDENDEQLQVAIETLMAMISGNPIPTSAPTPIPTLRPTAIPQP